MTDKVREALEGAQHYIQVANPMPPRDWTLARIDEALAALSAPAEDAGKRAKALLKFLGDECVAEWAGTKISGYDRAYVAIIEALTPAPSQSDAGVASIIDDIEAMFDLGQGHQAGAININRQTWELIKATALATPHTDAAALREACAKLADDFDWYDADQPIGLSAKTIERISSMIAARIRALPLTAAPSQGGTQ